MTDHSSVLLVRDDGVIDVPGAVPWPTALADTTETLLARLIGPRDETSRQQGEDER